MTLSALLALAACGDGAADGQPGISRQEYIDTYVEILLAADVAEDSVAATEAARAILARRGLTEGDLLEFGHRYREDPEYLAEVWSEIEERLKEPQKRDSAPER